MSHISIALAGNPNCGKTTLFNKLTGAHQHVANWPGVTVERKTGRLLGQRDVLIQDLPGIYSLSPYSLEEVVSRDYLLNEHPDAIINIVDASNLERNLYLTTQLREIGIPVVIGLNMIDLVRKNGDRINIKKLSAALGCEVVETSAVKGIGCKYLGDYAVRLAVGKNTQQVLMPCFSAPVERALAQIETLLQGKCNPKQMRWFSIRVFEKDEKAFEFLKLNSDQKEKLLGIVSAVEAELDDDSESIIANDRYNYISNLVRECVEKKRRSATSLSDRIDSVVTNRWLALPIFALLMWGVYYLAIQTIGAIGTDWVNDVLFGEWIPGAVGSFLESIHCAEWLQALILDGIIAGVGAVLGFLPQMMVLFVCLALLEDCGYMARVAFVMDRLFRKFGLSGKSFIPLMVANGCGVPAIMSSRTIENERDRRMTVLVTTFVPCSAKLPIIALIAGAFFPNASWVAPSAYFVGLGAVILSGIILKKTSLFGGEPAPFVMELPTYHPPGTRDVALKVYSNSMAFVKKAGTIILVACALVWFLSSYNIRMESVDPNESMLASLGGFFAPLFTPLGWGDWKATVATISGLVAKENLVGTFGILYGMEEVAEDGMEVWPQLQLAFTALAAYSLMIFNLLCAPCFAAIGAIRRETGRMSWTLGIVAYQCALAYAIAFIVYQIGNYFLGATSFGVGQVFAFALTGLFIYLIFRKTPQYTKKGTLAWEQS